MTVTVRMNPIRAYLSSTIREALADAYDDDSNAFLHAFKYSDKSSTGVVRKDKFTTILSKIVKETTLKLKTRDIDTIAKAYASGTSKSSPIQYKVFLQLCEGRYKKVIVRSAGDRVECKLATWTDWYMGTIKKVRSDKAYDVLFDDGEKHRVTEKQVKKEKTKSGRRRDEEEEEDEGTRPKRKNARNYDDEVDSDDAAAAAAEPNPGGRLDKRLRRKMSDAYEEDRGLFDRLFKPYDKSGSGFIKSRKFKELIEDAFRQVELKLTPTEISSVSRAYKKNQKVAKIEYKLFLKLLRGDYIKPAKLRKERDRVECKLDGWTEYYRGKITKVNDSDGTYNVTFDDGEKKTNVTERQIKGAPASSSGSDDNDDNDDDDDRRRGRRSTSSSRSRRSGGGGKDDDDVRSSSSKKKKRVKEKGDRVEAKCTGWTRYFPGTITKRHSDGTYSILFDDGEKKTRVPQEQLKQSLDDDDDDDADDRTRRKKERRVGDRVEAKLKGWTQYYPGKIKRVRLDGTIDIIFDDGDTAKEVDTNLLKSDAAEMRRSLRSSGGLRASASSKRDSDDDDDDEFKNKRSSSRRERAPGDRIEVKISGWSKYFWGIIDTCNRDGTFAVTFETDGEHVKRVKEREIRGNLDVNDDSYDRNSRGRSTKEKKRRNGRSEKTLRKLRSFYSRAVQKGRARNYREIFETMDSNRDGVIDQREFYTALREINFDVDRQEVNDLIDDHDLNNNGQIEWREFLRLCAQNDGDEDGDDVRGSRSGSLRGSRGDGGVDLDSAAEALADMFQKSVRRGEARDLEEIFEALDRQRVGSISVRKFEDALQEDMKLNVSSRVMRALSDKFDRNGDGRIYPRDFIDFCTEKAKYERPRGRGRGSSSSSNSRSDLRGSRSSSLPRDMEADLEDAFREGRGRDLKRAFEREDRDRRETVDVRTFERILEEELRLRPTSKDVDRALEALNRGGKIDYVKFLDLCRDLGLDGGRGGGERREERSSLSRSRNDWYDRGASRDRSSSRDRDRDSRGLYDDDDRRGSRDRRDSRGGIAEIAERLSMRFKNMARDSHRRMSLEDVFDRFDIDRVGSVSLIEFEKMMADEIRFEVSRSDMRHLTNRFDSNGDGRVDRREFISFCEEHGYRAPPKMSDSERRESLASAKKVSKRTFDEARNIGKLKDYKLDFARTDIDGRGKIRQKDFERVLEDLDLRLKKREVESLVATYGSRGLIDYEEYLRDCGGDNERDPLRATRGSRESGSGGGRRVDVLIDEVKRVLRRAAGEGRRRDYKEIFEHMDHNDSGRISRREFQAGMTTLGVREMTEDDMSNMMARFDRNGDGAIDYREFLNLIREDDIVGVDRFAGTGGTKQFESRLRMKLRQSNTVRNINGGGADLDVRAAFESMDVNGKGYVTSRDFRNIATDHGWDLTKEEFEFLIRKFDRNASGSLEYQDFLSFISLDNRSIRDIESRFRTFLQKKNSEGVRFSEQFEWFDRDGTGFISEQNFREGLSNLGFVMTKQDVRSLMQTYDANFDGQISYHEFLEAFASGRDGMGMMRKGARSLRPSGNLSQSLTNGVPTRRLRDDPERWSSGLFYDCECRSFFFFFFFLVLRCRVTRR